MTGKLFYRNLTSLFRRSSVCLVLLFCQACSGIGQLPAGELMLEGFTQSSPAPELWQQGALIKGRVAPGSQLRFLDHDVYVSETGEFVLGLGRDAPAQVEVLVTDADGKQYPHEFAVLQRQYNIQRVEGVEEKYVTPSEKDQARIQADNSLISAARRLRDSRADYARGFIWPLQGPISGVYGSQRFYNGVGRQPHYGVDVAAPVGTLVRAPAAGIVTFVRDMYYSGWTLVLDHGQGLSSSFLHLSNVLVKVGDTVQQGDSIAEVGATGRVTGAHLDWRMNWLDQRTDPQLLVPAMPLTIEGASPLKTPSATE